MSLFSPFCRQCRLYAATTYTIASARHFSNSPVLLARKNVKKLPTLSKKALAAKARKKALKARKNVYDTEKMPLTDAIAVLRAVEVASPNSTYEIVIKTEMKKGTAVPKGRMNLPRETKMKTEDRILVFAEGRQADEARRAGAHIVGGAELIDGVISGRHQATTILCTPALIRTITPKLGRVLGPRGMMPSERRGTVTDDFVGYMRRIQGSSEWKGDKSGTIRTAIGKLHFPVEDVIKNIRYFLGIVKRATGNQREEETESKSKNKSIKPANALTKVLLSSTHGPGVRISDA